MNGHFRTFDIASQIRDNLATRLSAPPYNVGTPLANRLRGILSDDYHARHRIKEKLMDQLDEKVINTERLVLFPLKAIHAEHMFPGLSDLPSYDFTPDTPYKDVAALTERYQRLESRRSPDGREAWLNWVISSPNTQELLGYVQFTVKPSEQRALVAYFVFTRHRKTGIATEAIRALLSEVVANFRLARVDAEIDTRNAASIALVEKLGFARTRLVPHADEFKGAVSDEYHYSYYATRTGCVGCDVDS